MRLKDKVAIVTGAASGIGWSTCLRFVEEGAAVVLSDVAGDAVKQCAEQLRQRGGRAVAVTADMGVETDIPPLVQTAVETFGRLDIVVNNAAVFILKGLTATVEEWQRSFGVNVVGPSLLVKAALPALRQSGRGAIINLGSISSFIAQDDRYVYNASKGAVAQMTRCMAMDLAPDNIRVNAVCPGTIWTPIVQRLASAEGLDRAAADAHPKWGGAHLLHRCGDPVEVANAIMFLASDEASFITGECLMVDGGYTAA
jgi:NAD(P)-dependent dehydrogenase (short-subunit alcohol dehydrogenase family)